MNGWCGVIGDRLIGTFVLENNLRGDKYEVFLRNELPGLLEDIPLLVRSQTKVDSRAALRARIFAVAEQTRNHPDRIASAIQSLLIRAENCLANGGGHFEQLL